MAYFCAAALKARPAARLFKFFFALKTMNEFCIAVALPLLLQKFAFT